MLNFLLDVYNSGVVADKITSSTNQPSNYGMDIDGASFGLGIATGIIIAFFVWFIIYAITTTIKEKRKNSNPQNDLKSDE